MKYNYITKKNFKQYITEVEIDPSGLAKKNVCSTKKICDEQGQITFGQLRDLVESGRIQRIATHVGEGGYKAILRLVPWFLPQLVLLGFGATWIRVLNKLFRPTLEETTNYKTWWGKTILKIFDLVEGELNAEDPLSKIFFISDGLMTMLDEKYKVKFAQYIGQLADEKPDDEIVPEYFVENELRHWLNEKFFLDPPLSPKNVNNTIKKNNVDEQIKKKVILEQNINAQKVRDAVRDIVTVLKKETEGEFYLPEELDEEKLEYEYDDFDFSIELKLIPSFEEKTFLMNSDLFRNENVIQVVIEYNPEIKNKMLYDMIGELNELLGHEIRHIDQKTREIFNLNRRKKTGIKYYLQPSEIDAQVFGFRRMAKMTKRPFEELLRNWFKTHTSLHMLDKKEQEIVIQKVLEYNTKI